MQEEDPFGNIPTVTMVPRLTLYPESALAIETNSAISQLRKQWPFT
jgi:hypothetical protein